jgi:tRNA(Ile)-lysidine synthase
MTALAARVLADLRRLHLVRAGGRVVAALSGGPDSVALTRVLQDVLPALGATLSGVAHLHHGLRGAEADEDEGFCRALAATLGLDCLVERADVAAHARQTRVSLEVAGHRLRSGFFERARARFDAGLVATGHTQNDLAETFLLRAARGAGARGLGGIRVKGPGIIRPLLGETRTGILEYLASVGQSYREDASNRNTRIPRNHVRHVVLPWLEANLSSHIAEALARAARLAADDDRLLRRIATRLAPRIVLESAGSVSVEAAGLRALPVAIQRRIVLETLDRLSGGRTTMKAVDAVLDLLDGADKVAIEGAGGIRVRRTGARLVLEAGAGRMRPPELAGEVVGVLPVPGSLALPGGRRIEVRRAEGPPTGYERSGPLEATLDAGCVREPIVVRFRRPGDRLRPLGVAGHRKLQDVLVDLKVPRGERDGVPLVVDARGRILWVAGHLVSQDARVTSATTGVLLLKYRW